MTTAAELLDTTDWLFQEDAALAIVRAYAAESGRIPVIVWQALGRVQADPDGFYRRANKVLRELRAHVERNQRAL